MKTGTTFEMIGLPKGHAYPKLAYHPRTALLIVHTRPVKSILPGGRISLKRLNGSRYRSIANFPSSVSASSISVESFLLHPHLSLLYFITYVWSEYPNGPPGGDWDALYCLNLETQKNKTIVQKGGLAPPDGYRRVWINELLSTSADGNTLFCRAGFSPKRKGRVHYCLSKLSIVDHKIEIIRKLKTPFA
jgi:hypothetical protein